MSAGVELFDGPCISFQPGPDVIVVATPQGERRFECIYPALGSEIQNDLALAVGAEASEEDCLLVDRHQRCSVKGLYAAGDVVLGLDQISHAMGEGGVAATTIRNDLASVPPLWR